MAKYIDADAVIEELRQIYHSCDDWENYISQSGASESEKRILINRASATRAAMIEVRLRVDKMLPADVVEVVKCKDCICHPKMGNWGGEYEQEPPYRCPMEYEDEYYSFCPNPDDYCSYGTRRKDND